MILSPALVLDTGNAVSQFPFVVYLYNQSVGVHCHRVGYYIYISLFYICMLVWLFH